MINKISPFTHEVIEYVLKRTDFVIETEGEMEENTLSMLIMAIKDMADTIIKVEMVGDNQKMTVIFI